MKGSIRQRSPGSWELTIDQGRDTRGKRRRLLTTFDQGIDLPFKRITIREWLDRWMQEVIEPHRCRRTAERYRSIIDLHIAPAVRHVELAKLAPSHVQALESRLLNRGKSPHRPCSSSMSSSPAPSSTPCTWISSTGTPSPSSLFPRRHGASLRLLLSAPSAGSSNSPAMRVTTFTPPTTSSPTPATAEERPSPLRLPSVDLDNAHIAIEGSLVPHSPRQHRPRAAQDSQPPPRRRPRLGHRRHHAEHRAEQDHIKQTMLAAYHDRGFVFADPKGDWINPMQRTRTVKRLGHAHVSITSDIYAHALPGWQRQAAAFEEAMRQRG